jgi:hypothetical protein
MAKVLILQNDGFLISSTKFGYLYVFTFPFIILGAYFFLTSPQNLTETKLVLMWLISALAIGIFVKATFYRLNLAFIPLFIFCAAFMHWLNKKNKVAFIFSIALFLAGFLSFTYYYHNLSLERKIAHRKCAIEQNLKNRKANTNYGLATGDLNAFLLLKITG